MRIANLLRVIVFAISAGYLIFTQDHSFVTGANALEYAGTALCIAGGALMMIPSQSRVAPSVLLLPTITSGSIAYFLFLTGEMSSEHINPSNDVVFRLLVAVFIMGFAANELGLSFSKAGGDKLELRISAYLGIGFALLFLVTPLNDVNAVGFLSAYFALSAVQRAIWVSTPEGMRKDAKDK